MCFRTVLSGVLFFYFFSAILVVYRNAMLQRFRMTAFHVLSSFLISASYAKSNLLSLFCFPRQQLQFLTQLFVNFFSDMKIRAVWKSGKLTHYFIMSASLTRHKSEHFFLHREAEMHAALLLL